MRKLSLVFVLALGVVIAGCGDDDGNGVPLPGTAALRVVHASPDAPAVDIYVAGADSPVFTNVSYGETTRYTEIDPGTYELEVRPAGASPQEPPVFRTGPVALRSDDRVTAVAAGLLAGTGDTAFRVIPLVEGFAAPDSGSAIVRIVHASPDAPTVALDIGNDGSFEVTDLNRYADTGVAGVELPAGTTIQVGVGVGSPPETITSFTIPALTAEQEVFVIATGLVNELPRDADGFALLAVDRDGTVGLIRQNPVVYALHASPDAPPVDIVFRNDVLVADLAFGELSQAVQLPPDSYTLQFFPAGTSGGTPAATEDTPALAAGERYLAIASGFLAADGAQAFQLLVLPEQLTDEDASNARLTVVHASPDAPPVDVSTMTNGSMDTPPLVSDLAYTEATDGAGMPVPPTDLTVGVAPAGEDAPVAVFDIDTTPGQRAFVVAAGALSPVQGQESFRLFVVTTSTTPWQVAEALPN